MQVPLIPTILTYCEKDILNYYNDHYDRLKETQIKYMDEYELLNKWVDFKFKFPKLSEIKIIREQDNGWDMIKNVDSIIFSYSSVERILEYFSADKCIINMYKVYKENDCLDLFINYYGNYFGADCIVEQQTSAVAFVKMFLYAYTLEEDNGKSFYSLMNNDLRSGNPDKIMRYLPMIRYIYNLIKRNCLKSYSGDVYRATYFKQELIVK